MTIFERYKKERGIDDELRGDHVKVIFENSTEIIVRGIDIEYEVGRSVEYPWLERVVLNPITDQLRIYSLVSKPI